MSPTRRSNDGAVQIALTASSRLEEFTDRLASFEAREAQFVLAERRRELADPPVLGWTVSHKERPSLPHPGGPQQ